MLKTRNIIEGFFFSRWLTKFLNMCGRRYLKHKFEGLLYLSLFLIKSKLRSCPLFYLLEAIEIVKPVVGLKFIKNRQKNSKICKIVAIPFVQTISFQYSRGLFWLIKSIKLRFESMFSYRFVYELYFINTLGMSNAVEKKLELYKYAVMFKTSKRFKW